MRVYFASDVEKDRVKRDGAASGYSSMSGYIRARLLETPPESSEIRQQILILLSACSQQQMRLRSGGQLDSQANVWLKELGSLLTRLELLMRTRRSTRSLVCDRALAEKANK